MFFVAIALFQGLYAVSLLMPRLWMARSRYYLVAGVMVNTLVITLYIVTRTLGVPPLGPLSGEVEQVGFLDLASKLMEMALIGLLVWMVYQLRPRTGRAD